MSRNRRKSQNAEKPGGYGFVKTDNDTRKYVIALYAGCYICGHTSSSADTAWNHVRNMHRFDIPSRVNDVNRPLDRYYDYVLCDDTDEYDEAHFACPSCWFHCPMKEPAVFYDHTIVEHDPRRIIIEDTNEYDINTGTSNCRRGRPRRSYASGGEEEVPNNLSNSRVARFSNEREDVSSISEEDKNELVQKVDEFINLFRSLLRK